MAVVARVGGIANLGIYKGAEAGDNPTSWDTPGKSQRGLQDHNKLLAQLVLVEGFCDTVLDRITCHRYIVHNFSPTGYEPLHRPTRQASSVLSSNIILDINFPFYVFWCSICIKMINANFREILYKTRMYGYKVLGSIYNLGGSLLATRAARYTTKVATNKLWVMWNVVKVYRQCGGWLLRCFLLWISRGGSQYGSSWFGKSCRQSLRTVEGVLRQKLYVNSGGANINLLCWCLGSLSFLARHRGRGKPWDVLMGIAWLCRIYQYPVDIPGLINLLSFTRYVYMLKSCNSDQLLGFIFWVSRLSYFYYDTLIEGNALEQKVLHEFVLLQLDLICLFYLCCYVSTNQKAMRLAEMSSPIQLSLNRSQLTIFSVWEISMCHSAKRRVYWLGYLGVSCYVCPASLWWVKFHIFCSGWILWVGVLMNFLVNNWRNYGKGKMNLKYKGSEKNLRKREEKKKEKKRKIGPKIFNNKSFLCRRVAQVCPRVLSILLKCCGFFISSPYTPMLSINLSESLLSGALILSCLHKGYTSKLFPSIIPSADKKFPLPFFLRRLGIPKTYLILIPPWSSMISTLPILPVSAFKLAWAAYMAE
ncbi:hypothetical protein VP01_4003g1 [Puccinia sorghi]|uniref:Uncharacterized protein n=1 Tax=Puccinia sorghi TaxID=27349 RepID=A0A0L6URY8_9BASI|nr:hypothetical protein VP01_4003g1 [Puccinia sorghi]